MRASVASEERTNGRKAAVSALQDVALAQAYYRNADADGDGILAFAGDIPELARYSRRLRLSMSKATDAGYEFRILQASDSTWVAAVVTAGGRVDFVADPAGIVGQ
jgi:hypothetical protein